jgi:hypothetical protein
LERPAPANGSAASDSYDWNYCREMAMLPVHFELADSMLAACLPTADFDPWDEEKQNSLSTPATCKEGCKEKFQAWVSAVHPGWGCCAREFVDGFALIDGGFKKLSGW